MLNLVGETCLVGTLLCVFKFPKGLEGVKTETRPQRVVSVLEDSDCRAHFPALEAVVAAVRKVRSGDSLYHRSMDCRQFWPCARAPGTTPQVPMSVGREAAGPSLWNRGAL